MEDLRKKKRYVGLKMALRAIREGKADVVYMADDADEKIKSQIVETCQTYGLEVRHTETMKQLGKAASIDVGAAIVAIDKSSG